MRKSRPHHIVTSLTRQCVNCWLGYILAQPVDIDLPVVYFFIRQYVGFSSVRSYYAQTKLYVMGMLDEEDGHADDLIPTDRFSSSM